MREAIGLDVGGTDIKVVRVDEAGRVLERFTFPSSPTRTVEAVRAALAECGRVAPRVGLCAPGLVAPDGLCIAHVAGKLEVVGVEWAEALNLPNPVPVLNDAHSALWGESWVGAAQGLADVILLTLGTGVGGAVLWDGKLMQGRRGLAGSMGHLSLDPEGPLSIYNTPGSLEYRIGDASVRQRSDGRFPDTRALVEAHRAGDAEASRVWLRSVRDLAAAVASLINLFDPQQVVLAGGITAAGAALMEPLHAHLERFEYRPGGSRVPVVLSALGSHAGAVGAARKALEAQPTARAGGAA